MLYISWNYKLIHNRSRTCILSRAISISNAQLQRMLQLRIEEQARYLQKILEEQQKAGSALNPTLSLSAPTDPPSQNSELQQPSSPSAVVSASQHSESKTESSSASSLPSKHKANGVGVNECKTESRLKRFRFEDKPESAIDEAVVWKILCNNSFTQLNSWFPFIASDSKSPQLLYTH